MPYRAIAHPLYAGVKSFDEVFNGQKVTTKEFGSNIKLALLVKSIVETVQTLRLLWNRKPALIIAIDPLNALTAVLLKKFGKASRVVFYTVDYTPTRFLNKLLNLIYHWIDMFCIKNADAVWNVSNRIVEKRQEQGVSDSKNKYVPNSPSLKVGKPLPANKVDRNRIMMVTGITHAPAFTMVIDAVSGLIDKYPRLILSLIGGGPAEEEFKNKVANSRLKGHVEFLGQLDHTSLLNILPKGGLGLAIYTSDYNWVNYGDSMKAREYLLSGLPTIITDVVSTGEDIKKYGAGLIVKPTKADIRKAIEKLITDKEYWGKARNNALKLSRDFDMDKILDKAFRPFC